jgi:hypothetical protein
MDNVKGDAPNVFSGWTKEVFWEGIEDFGAEVDRTGIEYCERRYAQLQGARYRFSSIVAASDCCEQCNDCDG